MNPKNTFAILMFVTAGIFYYSFIMPFKSTAVDNVSVELGKLQAAYDQATQQLSLKTLRLKKQGLTEQNLGIVNNFVPEKLHSGTFTYNVAQLANQSGLTLKGLQYTVLDDTLTNAASGEKKLLVEFSMDGRYEDFSSWIQKIERSNVLIDVESIRGAKAGNSGTTINFNVKLYAYGINID